MPGHTQPCKHCTLALGLKHQTTHSPLYVALPVQCIVLPQFSPSLMEVVQIYTEKCVPKTDLPEKENSVNRNNYVALLQQFQVILLN